MTVADDYDAEFVVAAAAAIAVDVAVVDVAVNVVAAAVAVDEIQEPVFLGSVSRSADDA